MSDEQGAPKADSSPAKEKTPEAAQPEEPAPADPEAPDANPDQPEGEPVQPEEPLSKADERKQQLNTEIRDLVSQRNALKDEVSKANAEVYQPATEDELVQEGLSATDAKVEALRQRIEVKDFNDRVADAQLTIESESQRVLSDFPMFNPDNKEVFNEEMANEAATLLEANLIRDPNTGQVIGSNVSPYQLYKTLARASGISEAKGQIRGQQATERMLANADTASSAAPPKKAVDPVIALWESDD
jgi:hypothetical protein